MDKTLLLASFIFPERLDWFYNYLNLKFKISKDRVFVYKNLDDESKLIVTFKLVLRDGKKIDLNTYFPNTIPIHKKGDAMYTINALNKLIEFEIGGEIGNINHKEHKINWDNYQNKIILNNKEELIIYNIERLF
jgi:hypothetical protein